MNHNASGSYSDVVANGDSGDYGDVASYPAVVADSDGKAPFGTAITFFGKNRVAWGEYAHVWPDEDVVADCDLTLVENREVEVGEEIFADRDVGTVVAEKRLDYFYIVARLAEYGFYFRSQGFGVGRIRSL